MRLLESGFTNRLFAIGAVIWLAFTTAFPASAQVQVAYYPFTGDSLASSSTDTYATASNILAGPGLSGDTEFDSNSGSTELGVYSGYVPTSETSAITGSDYISFTITPTSKSLSYNGLSFGMDVEAFENPTAFSGSIVIRWSVDGFTSDLLSKTIGPFPPGPNNGQSGASTNTLSFPAQSGPVTFNCYFYDNQNDDSFNTISVNDIAVTATPVPEPSAWVDLILSAGGLMFLVKHRQSKRL